MVESGEITTESIEDENREVDYNNIKRAVEK